MKRLILIIFTFFLLPTNEVNAQDLLVMKDGAVVKSKIQEITETEIKYKKFSLLDGPLYTISIDKVLSINFENGEVEKFEKSKEKVTNTNTPKESNVNQQPISKPADSNNDALLKQYNREIAPAKPKSQKNGYIASHLQYVSYGITNDSSISNEDIEISFERTGFIDPYFDSHYAYNIKVKNKTNENIIIDLAQSCRTESDESYRIYYNPNQSKSTTQGASSNSAFFIGPIGFGGSESGTSTTFHNPEKYRIIAANSTGYFSEHIRECLHLQEWKWEPRSKYETISEGEFLANEKISNLAHYGEIKTFDENTTPYKINYKVYYYKDSEPNQVYTTTFTLYVHQLFGYRKWKHLFGNSDPENLIILKSFIDLNSSDYSPCVSATIYN